MPTPKNSSDKESSNYLKTALTSHASKVMLKIFQDRLQQYVNWELPDVQVGFRKARGTRDQIANICWSIEKAREFQINIYFCFINYTKAFDGVDHKKQEKIKKEMGISDHRTCLLRNLCLLMQSCPTLCNPMGCSPPGSSAHGDSPSKNTRVSCQALLQGIIPTQGSNLGLLHCRQIHMQVKKQQLELDRK